MRRRFEDRIWGIFIGGMNFFFVFLEVPFVFAPETWWQA